MVFGAFARDDLSFVVVRDEVSALVASFAADAKQEVAVRALGVAVAVFAK